MGRFVGFDRSLVPVIFGLAGPTMLEQLMQTAVQYVDTAMVGSLGTEATAAVGATSTVNWLVGSAIYSLGIGFLATISQALGRGDKEAAAKAATQTVVVAICAGLLFSALTLGLSFQVPVWMQVDPAIRQQAGEYFFLLYTTVLFRAALTMFGTALRAAGDTKTPMRVSILMNLVNVSMNFFLIYACRWVTLGTFRVWIPGAGLGIHGAAIASALAYAIGGIFMTVMLWKHPVISPRGRSLRPELAILKPCMRIAIPSFLQRFCTSLGYVVFASMINSIGEISTAAHTIANTVESAFYVPGYGMMTAAATLTGNCIGAKDRKRLDHMSSTLQVCEFTLMVVSGGLLFTFAPQMTGLFTKDPEVIRLCSLVLRMVAISEPFYGISIIIEGMLMGAGETLRPFLFNVCSMWIIRILGTAVFVLLRGNGLGAAWGCMIAGNMTLMVLYVLYLPRKLRVLYGAMHA